jgi:hypothetical protein
VGLVDFRILGTELLANSFLENTEIVEGTDPSYNLHVVAACEEMVDRSSLALVVAHYSVVLDLSFVLPMEFPDLIVAVDPVLVEFLVVNDCLKVLEALANFVLNVHEEK